MRTPAYNAHYHDGAGRLHATRSTEFAGRYVEGRCFFDGCRSDGEHLTRPLLASETERRTCRVDVEDLLPAPAVGRRGRWRVTVTFTEE